jgi:peroxiredoxin
MPGRPPLLRAVALVAIGALLAGCGAQDSSAGDRVAGAEGVSEQGYVSGDGTTTIIAAADRQPAPALTGETLDGGTFVLADHLGEVVVLNVWASWCAPCRAEAADLQQVWTQVQGQGVQFVGLNNRDSAAPAQAFVDRFGLTYPNVVDTDGSKQLLFHESLPPAAIPSTLVIDQQGRVAARAIGQVDRSRLLGLIEPILAEGQPGAGNDKGPQDATGGDESGSGDTGGDSTGGDSGGSGSGGGSGGGGS